MKSKVPSRNRLRPFLSFVVMAVSGFLFYWWLVAKLQAQMLGAAAILGLVTAGALTRVAAAVRLSVRFKSRPDRRAWQLPGKVLHDAGLLLLAVGRGAGGTGRYRRLAFHRGGKDAASATRRALVLAGVSLPPNTFAVEIRGQKSLLIHQLIFQSEPHDQEWPI